MLTFNIFNIKFTKSGREINFFVAKSKKNQLQFITKTMDHVASFPSSSQINLLICRLKFKIGSHDKLIFFDSEGGEDGIDFWVGGARALCSLQQWRREATNAVINIISIKIKAAIFTSNQQKNKMKSLYIRIKIKEATNALINIIVDPKKYC